MFSGSAVVDWHNTSGLGKDGKPPMVLIYTAAGNPTVQCLASSTDGRTFTKFAGNPVVKQITGGNRDPKVIWHEPTQQWVMVLYVEWQQAAHHPLLHLAEPERLDAGQHHARRPGRKTVSFECPDFFELPVDGDAAGRNGCSPPPTANMPSARSTAPGSRPSRASCPAIADAASTRRRRSATSRPSDGRRIQIGWFQTETKGMPFNQCMTVPLELSLASTADGPRLTFTPVKELEALRAQSHRFEPMTLEPGDRNPLAAVRAELVELRAEFEPGDASEIVFNIRDVMVVYDPRTQELSVNDHRAPAPLREGKLRLTIYCDRTGLEVFASDGLCYVPLPFNTRPDQQRLFLETRGGAAQVTSLEVHTLRSAWRTK